MKTLIKLAFSNPRSFLKKEYEECEEAGNYYKDKLLNVKNNTTDIEEGAKQRSLIVVDMGEKYAEINNKYYNKVQKIFFARILLFLILLGVMVILRLLLV